MASDTSFWNHPLEKLEEALSIKRQIASLEARLSSLFGASSKAAADKGATTSGGRGRRKMSPAARAKIAAAQRARWARAKGEGSAAKKTTTARPKKRRSGLTAAGRKKLSENMKARWAARRKGR